MGRQRETPVTVAAVELGAEKDCKMVFLLNRVRSAIMIVELLYPWDMGNFHKCLFLSSFKAVKSLVKGESSFICSDVSTVLEPWCSPAIEDYSPLI